MLRAAELAFPTGPPGPLFRPGVTRGRCLHHLPAAGLLAAAPARGVPSSGAGVIAATPQRACVGGGVTGLLWLVLHCRVCSHWRAGQGAAAPAACSAPGSQAEAEAIGARGGKSAG